MLSVLLRYLGFLILYFFTFHAFAKDGIPSKAEFDAMMVKTVKQLNEQMSGKKIDEGTMLKFVKYDKAEPLFTYFYTSTAPIDFNIKPSDEQVAKMKRYYVPNTCSTLGRFMKQYNLKVAHIVEGEKTGRTFIKVTVSYVDC